MTYDELSEAYETAQTPEEKKIAEKRLITFEANVEKANAYFQNRAACQATADLMWHCDNAQSVDLSRISTIEQKVRAYKREYHECGCAKSADVMRSLYQLF
jgi:tartrate dehydratase alpha subunit/fumarate hydratase class I-like protein